MGSFTLERCDEAWLDGHVEQWVDAGLVTDEQADAIRGFERHEDRAAKGRLSLLTEVAAYVGSVIALMGGAAAVGESWDRIGLVGKLAVAAAVAVVGFTAGTWLVRLSEPGTVRLGSFLWMIGAGGVAMASAVLMDRLDPADRGWIAVAAGLPVMLIGLMLWRNRDLPLQLLTAVAGLVVTVAGLGEIVVVEPWLMGVVFLVSGSAFAALAFVQIVGPRLVALAVGGAGAYVGGFMLGELNEHLGPATALTVAVVVVAVALHERLVPLLVIGVIGALVATEALLATTFTGVTASLIVSLLGLTIVAIVVLRARRPS